MQAGCGDQRSGSWRNRISWFGVVISGIGMFPSVLHRAGKPLKSRAQQNPFDLFPPHRPLIHIPALILFSQCVLEVWACFRAYRTRSSLNTGFFVLLRGGAGRAQPLVPLTNGLGRTRKAGYWVFLGSGSCTHLSSCVWNTGAQCP